MVRRDECNLQRQGSIVYPMAQSTGNVGHREPSSDFQVMNL